jgi:predicted methyltransferase
MKSTFLCAIALCFVISGAATAAEVPGYVIKAVANPARSKVDRNFDIHRLPAETIAFAGVEPGMVIAEFIPGDGYFSRILSRVVGPKGKIYGIENTAWTNPAFDKKLMGEYHNVILRSTPFGTFDIPEKIDLFWTTQNYHDMHILELGPVDLADFNRRVFDALKPGGIYFINDQAGNPGTTEKQIRALHRIDEAQVISEVTAAGFVFIGESDVLRHPYDDRARSVFDPLIRGQTDEFLLKFQKPK